MDSKCRFFAKPEEHIFATSCRIFLGPHTKTPTSGPLHPNSIPTSMLTNSHIYENLALIRLVLLLHIQRVLLISW